MGGLGMRRISWIRLTYDAGDVRAIAYGQRHRLPVAVPVPLDDAIELMRRGVPSVVRRQEA